MLLEEVRGGEQEGGADGMLINAEGEADTDPKL